MTLEEALQGVGILPELLPPGTMGVARACDYQYLSKEAAAFARNPNNDPCLVFQVEKEFDHAGIILRNLHREKEKSRYIAILETDSGPYFHNLTPALPLIWKTGVAVACEGAKDARVLHQLGLPGVAYLGAIPSTDWLKVIRRYCRVLLWIPDNDAVEKPKIQWVRAKQAKVARDMGLFVREVKTLTKDPGELVYDPGEAENVQRIFWETVSLYGCRRR